MLQADTRSGIDRLFQYGLVARAAIVVVALVALALFIVSTWDNTMGNVLFGILVTSAAVVALVTVGVVVSNLVRS